jgi:hypothetical protein
MLNCAAGSVDEQLVTAAAIKARRDARVQGGENDLGGHTAFLHNVSWIEF